MARSRSTLLGTVLALATAAVAATGLAAVGIFAWGLESTTESFIDAVFLPVLSSDLKNLDSAIDSLYGELSLGPLGLESGGQALGKSTQAVDLATRKTGVETAILGLKDGGFATAQTSVRTPSGERAASFALGADSPASVAVLGGEEFVGRLNVSGRGYVVALKPRVDAEGKVIGALLAGKPLQELRALVDEARNRSLLALAAAILAMAILASAACALLLRSSLRPLRRAVELLGDIAQREGDLTRRIESGGAEETVRLAAHFNAFVGRLAGELDSIKEESSRLSAGAAELELGADDTAARAQRIGSSIDGANGRAAQQVAAAAETEATARGIVGALSELDLRAAEESAAIESSAASIERVATALSKAARLADGLSESIRSLEASAEAGHEAIASVMRGIAEASTRSQSLLDINDVISNVASRTNLLAMNAAIEAAHAGEAGSGFAVVADEIRKLAEESAVRSKEAASALKGMKTSIDGIVDSSRHAEKSLENIGRAVVETGSGLESVSVLMSGRVGDSEEALRALSILRSGAASMAADSAAVKEGGAAILERMERLIELGAEIRSGLEGIAEDAGLIAGGAGAAAALARANAQSSAALDGHLARYRTS